MLLGPLYTEVCCRLPWARYLGSDACVTGLQCCRVQSRVVGLDGSGKSISPGRVSIIIDLVHPFDIGSKLCLTRQVQCQMYTQATRLRQGVDETLEGALARQAEVVAFG
jgi:hypothetical protein